MLKCNITFAFLNPKIAVYRKKNFKKSYSIKIIFKKILIIKKPK